MALTQGLLNDYWQRYNQRRALTGLPSSYQEQRGTLDPMLENVAQQDTREAQLRYQNQQANRTLDMQQQQITNANRAATISGATNIAALGAQGYLGYKMVTKPPSALETAMANRMNGAPAVDAGAGSGGGGILQPGAGSGSVPASTLTDAQTAYDVGGPPGGNVGYEGAGSTGAGGLTGSTVGNVGAGAAVGAGANYLTTQTPVGRTSNQDVANLSRNLGMTNLSNEQYAAKGSMTAGGAVAGGGWGAAIGATVYDITNLAKTGRVSNELLGIPFADKFMNTNVNSIFDTVICSELLRQGKITERERAVCVVFRFRHIPDDMFCAYLEWAAPIVAMMKRGGAINALLLPFAKAFIGYMLSIQAKRVPSFTERMVWKYAWSRCRGIVRKYSSASKEVSFGIPG